MYEIDKFSRNCHDKAFLNPLSCQLMKRRHVTKGKSWERSFQLMRV